MKKIFLILGIVAAKIICAQSIQPFDSLTINNLNTTFNAAGDQLYQAGNFFSHMSTPENGIGWSVGNLWIGGYDNAGNLHVAAQTYRQNGTDFWPGPLDSNTVACHLHEDSVYNHIWKINKTTIDSFRLGLFSSVPQVIQNWPGNGNPVYATSHFIAPYVDANSDGSYNAANGDYPNIRGDQALFYIYNDTLEGYSHTETHGRRLGFEIRVLAYEVKCPSDSALMNTVFVHCVIIDRCMSTYYDSLAIGVWNDFDVAGFNQNFMGSDSSLGALYTYSGTNAIGTLFLNQPLSGAMSYQNDFTALGNPSSTIGYYRLMRQRFVDGTPLTYGGNGYGGNQATGFRYPGDPTTGTGWIDSSSVDDRTVATFYPGYCNPGQVFTLDYAYVYAHDTGANFNCVNVLKQRMQSIKNYYVNDNTPCGNNITSTQHIPVMNNTLTTFPNPTISQITIRTSSTKLQPYYVFDTAGRLLLDGTTSGNETVINVQQLPAGIYFVKVGDDAQMKTVKFVKCE